MKIKDQVTNVELSNKLKDLGVVYPSLFFRDSRKSNDEDVEAFTNYQEYHSPDNVNCFTVAELGEMLPDGFATHIMLNEFKGQWRCVANLRLKEVPDVIAQNEADARGLMLIALIENGKIYEGDDSAYSFIQ